MTDDDTLRLIPFQPVPKLDFACIEIGTKEVERRLTLINPTPKPQKVQFVDSFREFSCNETNFTLEPGQSRTVTFTSSPNEVGMFRRSITIRINNQLNLSIMGFGSCVIKKKRAHKRRANMLLAKKRSLTEINDMDNECTPKLIRCGDAGELRISTHPPNLTPFLPPTSPPLHELNGESSLANPLDMQEPTLIAWLNYAFTQPLNNLDCPLMTGSERFQAERMFLNLKQNLARINITHFSLPRHDFRLKIEIRPEIYFTFDAGSRDFIFEHLLSYNTVWLRLALEILFSCKIRKDTGGNNLLKKAISQHVLDNCSISQKYSITNLPRVFKNGHKEEIAWHVLSSFLSIAHYLDIAKCTQIKHLSQISLFKCDGIVKSTRELVERFCKQFLLAGTKQIMSSISLKCYQLPIEEYKLADVVNLNSDLRDGVRLARLAQIRSISSKPNEHHSAIKCPASDVIHKIQNHRYALDLFKKSFSLDTSGIYPKMLALGNRKQTVDLLWRLVFSVEIWTVVKIGEIAKEILFLRKYTQSLIQSKPIDLLEKQMLQNLLLQLDDHSEWEEKDEDFERSFNAESKLFSQNLVKDGRWLLGLLFKWAYMICDLNDIKIHNLTSSFSNGLAFTSIISHYRPDLIILSRTSPNPSPKTIANNFKSLAKAMSELGSMPLLIPKTRSDCLAGYLPDQKCVAMLLAFLASKLIENQSEIRAARMIWNTWIGYKKRKCAQIAVVKQDCIVEGLINSTKQCSLTETRFRVAIRLQKCTEINRFLRLSTKSTHIIAAALKLATLFKPKNFSNLRLVCSNGLIIKKKWSIPAVGQLSTILVSNKETVKNMVKMSRFILTPLQPCLLIVKRIEIPSVNLLFESSLNTQSSIMRLKTIVQFAELFMTGSQILVSIRKLILPPTIIALNRIIVNQCSSFRDFLPLKRLTAKSQYLVQYIRSSTGTFNYNLHMFAAKSLLFSLSSVIKSSIRVSATASTLNKLSQLCCLFGKFSESQTMAGDLSKIRLSSNHISETVLFCTSFCSKALSNHTNVKFMEQFNAVIFQSVEISTKALSLCNLSKRVRLGAAATFIQSSESTLKLSALIDAASKKKAEMDEMYARMDVFFRLLFNMTKSCTNITHITNLSRTARRLMSSGQCLNCSNQQPMNEFNGTSLSSTNSMFTSNPNEVLREMSVVRCNEHLTNKRNVCVKLGNCCSQQSISDFRRNVDICAELHDLFRAYTSTHTCRFRIELLSEKRMFFLDNVQNALCCRAVSQNRTERILRRSRSSSKMLYDAKLEGKRVFRTSRLNDEMLGILFDVEFIFANTITTLNRVELFGRKMRKICFCLADCLKQKLYDQHCNQLLLHERRNISVRFCKHVNQRGDILMEKIKICRELAHCCCYLRRVSVSRALPAGVQLRTGMVVSVLLVQPLRSLVSLIGTVSDGQRLGGSIVDLRSFTQQFSHILHSKRNQKSSIRAHYQICSKLVQAIACCQRTVHVLWLLQTNSRNHYERTRFLSPIYERSEDGDDPTMFMSTSMDSVHSFKCSEGSCANVSQFTNGNISIASSLTESNMWRRSLYLSIILVHHFFSDEHRYSNNTRDLIGIFFSTLSTLNLLRQLQLKHTSAVLIQKVFRYWLKHKKNQHQEQSLCTSSYLCYSFSSNAHEILSKRFSKAIKVLQSTDQLYLVHRASGELEIATIWSSICCQSLAQSSACLDVFMDVLANCNRSPNHQAIIACILQLLLNLALCPQSIPHLASYAKLRIRANDASVHSNTILFLTCLLCRHSKNVQIAALFCALLGKLCRFDREFVECVLSNKYWFNKLKSIGKTIPVNNKVPKYILLQPAWSLKSKTPRLNSLKDAYSFLMKLFHSKNSH